MIFQHQIQTSLLLTFLSLVVVCASGCFIDDQEFLEPGEYLFESSLSESGEDPELPAGLILTVSEDKQSYSFSASNGEEFASGQLEVLPTNLWPQVQPTNFNATQLETFRLLGSFSLGLLDYTEPGLSVGAVLSPWTAEGFLECDGYDYNGDPFCLRFCLLGGGDECVDGAAGDDDDSAAANGD